MNRASPTYLRKLPAPSLSSPLCVMATSAVRWATTGSSKSWLQRQRNDAWNKGDHRSRAYYKLEQMDAKHAVLSPRPYQRVILDLGCSPGGWAEYAAQFLHREALRTKSSGSGSKQQLGGGCVELYLSIFVEGLDQNYLSFYKSWCTEPTECHFKLHICAQMGCRSGLTADGNIA